MSFELFINWPLRNETFEKIFQIYPCIRNFGQGFYSMMQTIVEHNRYHDINPVGRWLTPPLIENFVAQTADINGSWSMPNVK